MKEIIHSYTIRDGFAKDGHESDILFCSLVDKDTNYFVTIHLHKVEFRAENPHTHDR